MQHSTPRETYILCITPSVNLPALQERATGERRTMAWRATPRGFRVEFDEMLADMQREFAEMMERISGAAQQIPLLGGAEMTIDVREHDADVIVVADLPGVESKDISVRLLDPRTLRISARREEAREAEQPGYYIRERRIGAISRTVSLPSDVTEEEARATFKNGVLEVRLKKTAERGGKAIPVSGEIKMIEPGMQGNPGAETTAERLREHKEELYEE
jgi:HSP20 family protein